MDHAPFCENGYICLGWALGGLVIWARFTCGPKLSWTFLRFNKFKFRAGLLPFLTLDLG